MTTFTGFGDEIAEDLDVQLSTMRRLGVEGLDLRTAFGKNVLDLTDDEAIRVAERAETFGIKVHSVSSPVNKASFSDANRVQELRNLERACDLAALLGIRRIRIFSPETPSSKAGRTDDPLWPEVRSWMADQVELAKDKGAILLHENDGRFFGAYPSNARRLLETFAPSGCFRAVFDFGNSALLGFRTMRDWFPWLLPYLDTLHIKDGVESEHRFVASGEGDGEMVAAFRLLRSEGWEGPLTLEPHAEIAGPSGGFSGVEAFEHAVLALRNVLKEANYA